MLIRGFDRTATGALSTSSAAPSTNPKKNLGWAVNGANAAHRHDATAGLPAGAVKFRGRAYTAAGAVCFTTTKPAENVTIRRHGIVHREDGAVYAKASAPGVSAIHAGIERLLIDPADGAVFFDSVS